MIDSTVIRAHQHSAGARKTAGPQEIGRSSGGRSTKIHAAVDSFGLPIKFVLSEGQCHDAPLAPELIVAGCDHVLADRGYDSNAIRQHIRETGAEPVIPSKTNRINPEQYDEIIYKERNAVERFFAKIKHFRRIATRYEKLARNYMAMITLGAVIAWLRV